MIDAAIVLCRQNASERGKYDEKSPYPSIQF